MSKETVKKVLKNLVFVIIVGLLFLMAMKIENFLKYRAGLPPSFNRVAFWPLLQLFRSVTPVFIGLILGLPYCLSQHQNEGKWVYDWTRFFTIGIPALIATAIPFSFVILPVMFLVISDSDYTLMSNTGGIVAGYVILTSAKKQIKPPQ